MVSLDIFDGAVTVMFPYAEEDVTAIKRITSHWVKRMNAWLVSPSRLEEIYSAFPHCWTSPRLQKWLDLQRDVCSGKAFPADQPHWVACELLPHQRVALRFLLHFSKAALLDPPGTGKTRTAVAWGLRADGPRLVICPATVKYHWAREIRACDPAAEVFIVQGASGPMVAPAAWTILNYDILWKRLKDFPAFSCLIVDESHLIQGAQVNTKPPKEGAKPRGTRRGNAVLELAEKASQALFLTGSPVLNRPSELEPMLLALGKLHPKERFAWRIRYCDGHRRLVNPNGVKYQHRPEKWVWEFKGASNIDMLARELDTFSVRRSLADLSSSLPPVTHTLLEIDLGDLREHEEMRREMVRLLHTGNPLDRGQALAMVGRMLTWTGERKVPAVAALVQERLARGESPVVFSDFLAPLAGLKAILNSQSLLLDGSIPQERREGIVREFVQSPQPLCLLGSRRAMGTGTDGLQHRARTALFATLPWNPPSWSQAWARVAREGQKQPVEVITTIGRGTVEEAQLELLYRKAQVTDIICSNPSLSPEARDQWGEALGILEGMR